MLRAARATKNESAPKSITRRRTSADLYSGAPSAALATQNELEVLRALRLPRKTRRRPKASLVAGLPPTSMKVLQVMRLPRTNEPEVLRVLRLPRKTRLKCSKCCTCHAKRAGGAPSAALATYNEPEVL